MTVLGKKGQCKKCGALFRAPTKGLIRRRRIIQIISAIILACIFIGLPVLYTRAIMDANKRVSAAQRELSKLEGSLRLKELLDADAFGTIQQRLALLDPPEDRAALHSRIANINSKLKESGHEQVAAKVISDEEQAAEELPDVNWDPTKSPSSDSAGRKDFLAWRKAQDAMRAAALARKEGREPDPPKKEENKSDVPAEVADATVGTSPKEEAEVAGGAEVENESGISLESREPSVFGNAHDFLVAEYEAEGSEQPFLFLTGQDYSQWVFDYHSMSKESYASVDQLAKFREKGEFETTSDYEKEKATWLKERRDPVELIQEGLNSKEAVRTFVIDDLKVLDTGKGYDADNQAWKQLRCIFDEDADFKVSDFARAVSDTTVKKGSDIHNGETELGEAGTEWRILSQDEYLNLPIEIEEAKDFRAKLDADWIRVGLVIQFPGESRMTKPREENFEHSDPESTSVESDNRFTVVLKKIVIYNKETGNVFFQRMLSKPVWDKVGLPPTKENLEQLGL